MRTWYWCILIVLGVSFMEFWPGERIEHFKNACETWCLFTASKWYSAFIPTTILHFSIFSHAKIVLFEIPEVTVHKECVIQVHSQAYLAHPGRPKPSKALGPLWNVKMCCVYRPRVKRWMHLLALFCPPGAPSKYFHMCLSLCYGCNFKHKLPACVSKTSLFLVCPWFWSFGRRLRHLSF